MQCKNHYIFAIHLSNSLKSKTPPWLHWCLLWAPRHLPMEHLQCPSETKSRLWTGPGLWTGKTWITVDLCPSPCREIIDVTTTNGWTQSVALTLTTGWESSGVTMARVCASTTWPGGFSAPEAAAACNRTSSTKERSWLVKPLYPRAPLASSGSKPGTPGSNGAAASWQPPTGKRHTSDGSCKCHTISSLLAMGARWRCREIIVEVWATLLTSWPKSSATICGTRSNLSVSSLRAILKAKLFPWPTGSFMPTQTPRTTTSDVVSSAQ